ncbi:hypothetical protein KFE25_013999 [Diacronema lutheri]|uniref:Magnesium transporter n=1 Tax=Diacronema lutheri TaxID=2081491 RepID=A0A8J5XMT7_DIALT|nr:hypothetical protein KFE25_013999 [Diacronema lutheri]
MRARVVTGGVCAVRRFSSNGHFRAGKPPGGRWYDVWRIGADGARQRAPISHQQLLARASLFPRDLLSFDMTSKTLAESAAHGARPPRILVRESAIMVTADHLRCVIRRDELFLFDAERPMVADFARRLALKLATSAAVEDAARAGIAHWSNAPPVVAGAPATAADGGGGVADGAGALPSALSGLYAPHSPYHDVPPFEMRALDLLLEEVTASYARRAALLSPMVDSLLERMVVEAAPYSAAGLGLSDVSILIPLRDSLNTFELDASKLVSVLVDLLDSDEDMLDMLLTEKATLRGQRPPAAHHEAVELLLEEYVRQMASVLTEAQALKKRVASASELAQLHLDISRNRMVATNVHLSMVSTALAVVMTASGVFGMNLHSGLETDASAFQIVTASSSALGGCMLAACWSYLHGFRGGHTQQQLSLQLQAASAIRTVFRKLDSLQYVLAHKLRPPAAPSAAWPPAADDGGRGGAGGAGGAEPAVATAAVTGAPLSLEALKREVEQAAGAPLTAQELSLIVRLIERNEAGREAPGGAGGADGGTALSRSQIAALWRRVALPRDLWALADGEASPAATTPAAAPARGADGGGGGAARLSEGAAAARTSGPGVRDGDGNGDDESAAERGEGGGEQDSHVLASILDRKRPPQPSAARGAGQPSTAAESRPSGSGSPPS